jgi:hypothetical protein
MSIIHNVLQNFLPLRHHVTPLATWIEIWLSVMSWKCVGYSANWGIYVVHCFHYRITVLRSCGSILVSVACILLLQVSAAIKCLSPYVSSSRVRCDWLTGESYVNVCYSWKYELCLCFYGFTIACTIPSFSYLPFIFPVLFLFSDNPEIHVAPAVIQSTLQDVFLIFLCRFGDPV